ncbi:hypothetical protein NFI96_031888 [Prochilodus magdalenae]|nr:hypothetical protein NFI96_031888 [Prochilodus magdalenae]
MTSKMSSSEEQDLQNAERLDQGKRSDSPEPSCVSMKSDQSMDKPIHFRKETSPTEFRLDQGKRSDSPEPSCVSMNSDQSAGRAIAFRKETRSTEFREQTETSDSTKRNMELLFKAFNSITISFLIRSWSTRSSLTGKESA